MKATIDKRLLLINNTMDFLAWVRTQYGMHHLENHRIICEIGELDALEELHRLLYEWPDN